jgi:hypothetical protein
MSRQRIEVAALIVGALLLGSASMAAETAGTEQAGWRHTKQTFHYYGFTAHYTCVGLEDKVRRILLLLGARKDAKVSATGCEYGPIRPSRSAWVHVEFDALAPGPAPSGAPAVPGQWAPVEVMANHPFEMQEGDCELIEQMRDVLTKSFAFKDLEYRTNCVPHQQTLGSYVIKGQVLREAPQPPAAAH